MRPTRLLLAALTGVLLLVAASRIVRLGGLEMNWDEVWSVWQTFGSPQDILRWTPFDWPPLYFLTLAGWKALVGFFPLVLRYLSASAFLIGSACTYRAVRRIWGERAAFLSVLIYGAMGLSIFLSLVVRGYAFLLALTPLALWLTVRYFDRPTVRRAVVLALCLGAMFYIHFIAAFVFVLLGIYTLLVYRRAVWRWWLPGVIGGALAAPELISRWATITNRTGYNATITLPPLPEALVRMFASYTGPYAPLWAVLFLLAAVLLLFRRVRPSTLALLIWIAGPLPIYLFHSRLGLFQDIRYLWWVLPGLALWMGVGLARLPRVAYGVLSAGLVIVMFLPAALDQYQSDVYHHREPFEANFKLLRQHMQVGDVLLIDPNCIQCAPPEAWTYFMRLYFPNGLQFVTSPEGHRRIWYVSRDWMQDPATKKALLEKHVASTFFGPPTFLFRLYEGPPDEQGILFANGMRFHGAEIDGLSSPEGITLLEGQRLRLRLWWSVDRPVERDYSTSIQVPSEANPIQLDGPPQVQDAPTATSQWTPGRYYIDERDVQLPYPMKPGHYTFFLTVYQWWDGTRIAAPGMGKDLLLPIQSMTITSWSHGW
jgi:hypothetical protein